MVDPENMKVSTVDIGLVDLVRGGSLVTILDEADNGFVVCKLFELDIWVTGEQQKEEHTSQGAPMLIVHRQDLTFPFCPHLLCPVSQEVGDQIIERGAQGVRRVWRRGLGMMVSNTKLRSKNRILTYVLGQLKCSRM